MRGFTLLEVLLYISLLSILMMGVFSFVYVLIDSENNNRWVEEDTELINQKFF